MVVAAMVSMVAFLDSTVINVGLPATEHDLGGGLVMQQWVIDGHLLATAAAILPGGSISDLFGRVPVMRFGLLAFGAESVLAAVAASPPIAVTVHALEVKAIDKSPATEWFHGREIGVGAAAHRSGGHCGNQLDRDGVRLTVAHATGCLNISTSGSPNRGARC
jgi:MFS family permease